MKAREIRELMEREGHWVNWNRTCDQFLFGDPETEVKGIAVAWTATMSALQEARKTGCNVFVTHEPVDLMESAMLEHDHVFVEKREWLEKNRFVLLRCHDFWDDYPEVGIHGAWAAQLGLPGPPVEQDRFYEVHEVGKTTLGELAGRILERVRPLGQDAVHVVGHLDAPVTKLAIGTGAITNFKFMRGMGGDVLLVTDDGVSLWTAGPWSLDMGVPLIIVNHATAEEPGMVTLAEYFRRRFPRVKVVHVPIGCLYTTLT
ncbi:MAG: hypothetical protein Kow0069_03400 [Promethearchaeota archaeon]